MDNKKRVLFVGNGVSIQIGAQSKTNNKANTWDEIINEFAKEYVPQLDHELLKKLPYNMQIVAATHDSVDISMVELCRKLREITLDDEQKVFGRRILELPFDRIITTNYTYELERSVSKQKLFRNRYTGSRKRRSSDMTLFGYIPVKIDGEEKQIWHVHGHACAPNSVIMGHYFYGKLLARIQRHIPDMLKYLRICRSYKKEFEIRSWVDSFMTDDVYMVGFGMDLCESDIWWLVCCKKRHFPDSRIYFYVPEWDMPEDDPRRILMNAYGIIIREISCPEKDFNAFYEEILKRLSEIQ